MHVLLETRLQSVEQCLALLRIHPCPPPAGTPLDVTLSELAIEAFFPADERTAALLRKA